MYPELHLPAVLNPARSSEGEELPFFQHFLSTKTSYKFLIAWGKIINVWRHYLGKNRLSHAQKGNLYQSKLSINSH